MMWWAQTRKPFIVLELRAIVQLLPASQRGCFPHNTFIEHPQTAQLVFLRPGAKELLAWFKDNGYPMVLFTECSRQEIDVVLEATGIPETWFILVVDSSSPTFEAAGSCPPGLKDLSRIHPHIRSDQCILLDTSADHRCFESKGGQLVEQLVCQLPPFELRNSIAAAYSQPPDVVLIRQLKALARQSREEDKAADLLRIMNTAAGSLPSLAHPARDEMEDKKRPLAFQNLSIQMTEYLTSEEPMRTLALSPRPALRTGHPSSLTSSLTNSPVCPQDQRSLSLSMCTPIGRSGPRSVSWAENLVTDLEDGTSQLKRINSMPSRMSILKDGIQRAKCLPAMKSLQGPARFLPGSEIATALTQLPVSVGSPVVADAPLLCPGMRQVTLEAVLSESPENTELHADCSLAQAFEVLSQAEIFGCMLLDDECTYVGMVDVNDLALAIVRECQSQIGSSVDKPWFELAKVLQPQSPLFHKSVSQFVSSLPRHCLLKEVPRFTHDTPLMNIIASGFLSNEATATHQLAVLMHGSPRLLSSFDIISFLANHPEHLGKQGGCTLQELGLAKKNVLTISQETPAVEALYQMDRQHYSALAIVDVDGKFTGGISIEDFRGFVANDLPLLALPVTRFLNTRRRPRQGGGGSARCSSRAVNLWTATSAVTLAEAVTRLAPKTVTHLFVINKLSRPASVVSPTDILRILTSTDPAPTTPKHSLALPAQGA